MANSQLWNSPINSMADQIIMYFSHSYQQNDVKESIWKKFGRVCAILLWRRESYWVADAIAMTNVKVSKWKHGKKKTKWHRLFRTILGRNSIKNKRKTKQKTNKGPDMNLWPWQVYREKTTWGIFFKEQKNLLLFWSGKYSNLLNFLNK